MFGGRSGGAGSFLGDLWALKGLMDDGGAATWTKLVLPGPGPSPRCGHTTAAAGTQVEPYQLSFSSNLEILGCREPEAVIDR